MLYSDFAASGGVLGVALVDAGHAISPFAFSTPDFPQPTPRVNASPVNFSLDNITPDFPQPPPRLNARPVNFSLDSSTPDFPQPPPK